MIETLWPCCLQFEHNIHCMSSGSLVGLASTIFLTICSIHLLFKEFKECKFCNFLFVCLFVALLFKLKSFISEGKSY